MLAYTCQSPCLSVCVYVCTYVLAAIKVVKVSVENDKCTLHRIPQHGVHSFHRDSYFTGMNGAVCARVDWGSWRNLRERNAHLTRAANPGFSPPSGPGPYPTPMTTVTCLEWPPYLGRIFMQTARKGASTMHRPFSSGMRVTRVFACARYPARVVYTVRNDDIPLNAKQIGWSCVQES